VVTVIVQKVARGLLGPAVIVAAALIVRSYTDIGDGFSAGVVVALAVGLQYIALGPERAEAELPVLRHAPVAIVAGLLLSLAVGFLPVAAGEPPFTNHPHAGSHAVTVGTLELITAVAFDVGVFLLVAGVLVVLLHQIAVVRREREP
jgi:multisubunit Na+/H+ antiporter MnhB subunit